MSSTDRLKEAFIEGGREAIESDPELRALLDASPDFQRTLAAMEEIDRALPTLEPTRMPPQLLDRLLEIDTPRSGFVWWLRSWHARDYVLGVAAALLIVLPWSALWMLTGNKRTEFRVIELQPSTVRLDSAAIEERMLPKTQDGERVHNVTDEPEATITIEPPPPNQYKARLADQLAQKKWPNINPSALVNAFPYASGAAVELRVEVGPTPWSAQTRLVRVYVSTPPGVSAKEPTLSIHFNDQRVMSYRRIAEVGAAGATTSTLEGRFTALFEVAPLQPIGATLREESVYARLRYLDAQGERRVLQADGVERAKSFEAMPEDFRFAAAAAWLAIETKGGMRAPGLSSRLEQVMAAASRALGKEHRSERLTLIQLARAASDRAHDE
jgi:hypothetical protein